MFGLDTAYAVRHACVPVPFDLLKCRFVLESFFLILDFFLYGLKMFKCLSEKKVQTRKPLVLGMLTWMECSNGEFGVGQGLVILPSSRCSLSFSIN